MNKKTESLQIVKNSLNAHIDFLKTEVQKLDLNEDGKRLAGIVWSAEAIMKTVIACGTGQRIEIIPVLSPDPRTTSSPST